MSSHPFILASLLQGSWCRWSFWRWSVMICIGHGPQKGNSERIFVANIYGIYGFAFLLPGHHILFLGRSSTWVAFHFPNHKMWACYFWEEKDVMIYNVMVMVLIWIYSVLVFSCCFNFMAWTLQAIGSFESNLLNCLTPFGHRTKRLAILGDELRKFKTQHLKMSMKSNIAESHMCHRIKQCQWVPAWLWGIPLGVNSILIGGFFIMGPPLQEPC